jgi:hypothetical protein
MLAFICPQNMGDCVFPAWFDFQTLSGIRIELASKPRKGTRFYG